MAEQEDRARESEPAVPDGQAVEPGEPVQHRQPREQQQLEQHEVGAQQAAQARDLREHRGGPGAVPGTGAARPERDDEPRVGQREEGQEAAGDPPPGRAHA